MASSPVDEGGSSVSSVRNRSRLGAVLAAAGPGQRVALLERLCRLLTDLARRLDPVVVMPDAGVADSSVLLLLRPLTIDLLVGTGMDIEDARALLPKL